MTQTTTETTPEAPKARGKKTEKPNGQAGNGVATEPFPAPTAQPGDQGIATQEEDAPETYTPPEPTQQELAFADEVFAKLEDRDVEMSPEDAVRQIIGIVDVHKNLVTPPEVFGGKDDDRDIFAPASVVGEIARLIARRCPKLEAPVRSIGFFFKDHEKWTRAGVTIEAQVKTFDGFHEYHTEGMKAAVIVNYHHWVTLNPRQKCYVVYHALRQLDENAKRSAPDWVGYFEEPGLFGAGVHKEMVTMARAFVKDAPQHAGEPFQLSILDEVYAD